MEHHGKRIEIMKKKLIRIIVFTSILIVICLSVIFYQNNYIMKVTSIQIPTSKGILQGNLILPKHTKGKVGLVVFIHGDGPTDASYKGNYEPLWEELANAGYASLSWSKPGIAGSSGNWLDQSMDDRASQAREVIKWARSLPEIDTKRIGLWGASQAGWVIPKIVQLDDALSFTILVAPAINWIDQGLYNSLAQVKKDGGSAIQEKQVQDDFDQYLFMLEKAVTYQDYLKSPNADQSMSEERWNFELKNYLSDATEDIKHFYSPVKLFLGGQDIHVNSRNTKKVYEDNVPKNLLSVTLIPSTNHFMLRSSLVDSKSLTVLTALFAPRQLADQRYYEGIRTFLQSVDKKITNTKN